MYPRNFDYISPSSLDEATAALASSDDAKVMAGGMSLIPLMKMRFLSPGTVVDIGRIGGLDSIDDNGDHLALGALVRHGATASDAAIGEHATALAQAAALTGDVQVRNQGTTCGSVAHGDLAADQPAAVLALGGTLILQGPNGTRELAAADTFVDTLTTAIEPNEILVGLKIPKGGSSAYDKLGRRGGQSDYAVAGVAAWVQKSNGTVEDARVALSGVSIKPVLASGVAEALIGTDGSEAAIAAAAARATDGITILEDLYGSEEYKAHLATVYTARALTAAIG